MKKKVVSILLCTAMIATMAAGCGKKNSSDGSAKSNETVKLTVWAGEEDQDLTKELVSKFEDKNKDQKFDITVGVESESTAKDTILVDPEAAADVFAFASDQITDLVNANVLQEVQDADTIKKRM